MLNFLAQQQVGDGFWSMEPGSGQLWTYLAIALVAASLFVFGLSKAPTRARKPIVWTFTFLAGLFYVMMFLWPMPVNKADGDIPRGLVETVGFWLQDTQPRVADIANVLASFLLGLGIYSILRIHVTRLVKKGKDWGFSVVLLTCMVLFIVVGYTNWIQRTFQDQTSRLEDPANWGLPQYAADLLFNGLLQQMDSAMFAMIAFYILSAAYRAFRVRSVEASVLMISALVVILSIMGAVNWAWGEGINAITGNDPANFLNNFKINVVADWVRGNLQTPSIRALEFGVALGALAMGLRLWLGLEKGGVN